MKKIIIIFWIAFSFYSCEKTPDNAIILNDRITLNGESKDGIIKLNWNLAKIKEFQYYQVIRTNDYKIIANIYDFHTTSFTDSLAPLTENIEYQVIAIGAFSRVSSNIKRISNPLKTEPILAYDVLLWKEENLIFIFDRLKRAIYKYDYLERKIIDSLRMSKVFHYSSLGNNGKGDELYIPDASGIINIYNPHTFKLKDQLNTYGTASSAVTNNKGLLFTHTRPNVWEDPRFRVYNRNTKEMIDGGGEWDLRRLIINSRLNTIFTITINDYAELERYVISKEGKIESYNEDDPFYFYPLSGHVFRADSTGNFIISSNRGTLYDYSMIYITQLSENQDAYNDFCFDPESEYVYAGNFLEKRIDKFSVSGDAQLVKSYPCKGYPQFIFYLEDEILCVESTTSFARNNKSFLSETPGLYTEIIKLD